MMRSLALQRIFIAAYVTVASYCVLLTLVGPAGVLACRRLEQRRDAMQENLESLESSNRELKAELSALQSDPDRQKREARSLGYLAGGEVSIILPHGLTTASEESRDAGQILGFEAPASLGDEAIKFIALGFGLVSLILSLLSDLRHAPSARQESLRRKSYFRFQSASRT